MPINVDDAVRLVEDMPGIGLKSGAVGIVWALYEMQPPAYEIIFTDLNGKELSMLVYPEEIEALSASQSEPDRERR